VKSPYATWAHFVTAQLEVEQLEQGAKALLLDLDGNLAETVDGNIFVVRGARLLTPPCVEAVEGQSRRVTIELARGLGLDVVEAVLQVYDAVTADEVLVTTTGFCVVPVTRINGSMIGNGRPGGTWRRLIDSWADILGLDPVAQARANLSSDELAKLGELERRGGGTPVAEGVA
jgi:branched-chain amino acid aminotransferase